MRGDRHPRHNSTRTETRKVLKKESAYMKNLSSASLICAAASQACVVKRVSRTPYLANRATRWRRNKRTFVCESSKKHAQHSRQTPQQDSRRTRLGPHGHHRAGKAQRSSKNRPFLQASMGNWSAAPSAAAYHLKWFGHGKRSS